MRVTRHHISFLTGAVILGIGVYFIPQFFREPVNFTTQSIVSSKNPISEDEARAWISDDTSCEDICNNTKSSAFQVKICKCCGNRICEKERKEHILRSEYYCEIDCGGMN